MYSLVETNCPLCGQLDADIKFSFPKYSINVVRCRNCQMVWTTPRVAVSDLNNLYQPSYYDNVINQLEQGPASRFRKLISHKRRRQLLRSFAHRFSILKRAMPKSNVRLLEVGCGNGTFMVYLQDRDWQVTGADISPYAVTLARKRGLQVFQGELSESNFALNQFDGIVMHHVLEHVYFPKELLRETYRILKPDGILIIEVPNIDGFSARFFGPHWRRLALPLHVNHFSPTTLSLMLKQGHFTIKTIVHSSPDVSATWKVGFKAIIRMLLRRELEPSIFGYINETKGNHKDSRVPLRTDIIDLFLDPFFVLIPLLEKIVSSGTDFTIIASKKCSANENSENPNNDEPSV